MVTTPRGASASTKIKPSLEILPDSKFIVFNGDEHSASTFKLTGRVRLNCPEAMSICKPKIKLEGKRRISWVFLTGISSGVVEDKRVFINQERLLGGIGSTHKVNAGTIEWPFEFDLLPSMPESVEGLQDTFIVYHLHASVARPGWNQKDITARTHLRIVRTLGTESIESTRSRVNSDIWANKLSYNISIPSDAVIFGTSITADVELSPIKKGIKLGKVDMRLVETVIKRISSSDDHTGLRTDKAKSEELEVAREQMDFPESTKITYETEDPDNPVMADEMYRFQATLPLPKSLHRCRQDVDSHPINISHRFKLMVNIHNPEGHVSQLVCRLPVKLFISPNLPIDESNHVFPHDAASHASLNSVETNHVAPPQYGQHQLDQIFSDIDVAGYMSRAGSGPTTPAGLMAQSRRGSDENLRARSVLSSANTVDSHGSAVPAALLSRLADLQEADIVDDSGRTTPSLAHSSSSPISPTPVDSDQPHILRRFTVANRISSSVSIAAQLSMEDNAPSRMTPPGDAMLSNSAPADFSLHDLSRVPSYNAALRTPLPAASRSDHPPTYMDATSRPPSPQRPSFANLQSMRAGSPGSLPMGQSGQITRNVSDEEVRLQMLRARP